MTTTSRNARLVQCKVNLRYELHEKALFPLSNLQLKLLQLFSQNVSDEELKAIQRLIVQFFAEKATEAADKDWEEKGYDEDTFKKEHMRTPYKILLKP
jgi:hypothetical protein